MAIVGSSIVVGKIAVARVPVFLLSGLRFAVASIILMTLVALLERPLPRVAPRDVALLALQAFAGIFIFNVLLLYGLAFTSAGDCRGSASVCQCMTEPNSVAASSSRLWPVATTSMPWSSATRFIK